MANRLSRPLFLPDRYRSCIMESMRGRIMPSWRIIRCRSLLVLVLAILFSKIIHNGGGKEKRMYKEKYSLHIPCIYQTNSLPNFVRFNKNAQSHWLWAEILLIMERIVIRMANYYALNDATYRGCLYYIYIIPYTTPLVYLNIVKSALKTAFLSPFIYLLFMVNSEKSLAVYN